MNRILHHAATAALGLALATAGAYAQTASDHTVHHAGTNETSSVPASGPASGMPVGPGGMPGAPGAGMPAGRGGGVPEMMQMMQMMQMMGGMMARGGTTPAAAGMMRFDHIAGRIAFLKAELAITPEQEQAWTAFADALKGAAAKVRPMRARMPLAIAAGPFPERLRQQAAVLEARVAALRAITGPADALYRVLTPEQRRTADALMTGPRGMM